MQTTIKWLGEVTRVELGWVRSHIKHHPQPYGELKKVEKTTVDERVFIEVKICVLALDIHNTDTRQRTVSFPQSVHLSYVLIHVLALDIHNTDTRKRTVSFLQSVHLSCALIHVLALDIHNTDTRQRIQVKSSQVAFNENVANAQTYKSKWKKYDKVQYNVTITY